jgi:hypothetical protein
MGVSIMKPILVNCLLVITISFGFAAAIEAEVLQSSLTPVNLVFLARNGYFQKQQIPSNAGLKTAVKSGRVQAKDIVKAAIAEDRLSPETLNDRSYINSVASNLDLLIRR